MKIARSLSLFSGIGGFEVGMKDLGFRFEATLEIDEDCCRTLSHNRISHGSGVVVPTDITVTNPEDFFSGDVDYIVGGPPCQSFSAAGRRAGGVRGIADTRGTLFWHYCRFVDFYRPKAFVFENVRGILSSKKGDDFALICEAFREVGYRLYWRVLNAADFGVPQFRERLFLVGIRDDLEVDFRFPRPTHGPDSPLGTPFVTAGEALADLDDPQELVPPYGGKYGHLIPDIPEGENYRFFTDEMGHPEPRFAWRSRFSGFLYKMAKDEPCRTVVSQQGRYDGPFHWRNRKCRTEEFRRLQGFPDSYDIPHNPNVAVKQIGNSVAPPVAEALGRALRFQIEGLRKFELPLLEADEKLTFDRRKGDRARESSAKKKFKYSDMDQPSLFSLGKAEEKIPNFSDHVDRNGFSVTRTMRAGVCAIHVVDAGSKQQAALLLIDFLGPVSRKVERIEIVLQCDSFSDPYLNVMWQEAHGLMAEITSYDSLHPLWGHFTEPYPKFDVVFESDELGVAVETQRIALAEARGGRLIPFDEISHFSSDPEQFLRYGRELGFDIRTSNTNQTIPAGVFRICYPFTLPSSLRNDRLWIEPAG